MKWSIDNKTTIILEGRAARNYKEYSTDVLKNARIISNKYTVLTDLDAIVETHKTISISVYGDVFIGASASYEREYNERLFNIADCHGNFMEMIGDWCWNYPLTYYTDKIREINEE